MDKFFEATVQVTPPNHRDAIIKMAREAWKQAGENWVVAHWFDERAEAFERFAALVAAAEREILADWMRQHGFSTGQVYTMETLLDRLGTEMVENTDAAVLAEREACAKVCDFEVARLSAIDEPRPALAVGICAIDIRARGNT